MSDNQASSLCLICDNDRRYPQAQLFATKHQLPLYTEKNNDFELQLIFAEERIELYDRQLNTRIYVDFVSGVLAHRQQFGGGRGQPLAKAIGLKQGKNPSVLDVTAGLGRDAYILATLGCGMTLVEQSPILSMLIEDGIQRGRDNELSAAILSNQFEVHNQNSIEFMRNMDRSHRPDVIYLDPMYPDRKKSALVKKDMQILQRLLNKDDNVEALLEAALNCAKERVVVKRPIHANTIGSLTPSTSISSKKTRFDLYII